MATKLTTGENQTSHPHDFCLGKQNINMKLPLQLTRKLEGEKADLVAVYLSRDHACRRRKGHCPWTLGGWSHESVNILWDALFLPSSLSHLPLDLLSYLSLPTVYTTVRKGTQKAVFPLLCMLLPLGFCFSPPVIVPDIVKIPGKEEEWIDSQFLIPNSLLTLFRPWNKRSNFSTQIQKISSKNPCGEWT